MKYNEKNKPLVCMMTQSTCYRGTRKFTPKGVLWHSTGANNPNLKRYVQPDDNAADRAEWLNRLGKNAYSNDWNHIDRQAGLNFWIGKLADGTVAAVQTMPWNYRPWGCGSGSKGSCNDTHIQFEICEDGLNDKTYWEAVYKEACEMTAYLCKMFNIDPKGTISYNGLKVPTIIDHTGSHSLGLGSNHGDIQHWSRKYGVTMDTVRNDVAAILAADSTTSQIAPQVTGTASTADDAKAVWDRLYAAIQNPYGVAGVMGNMQAESGLRSDNLQNTYEKSIGMTDEQYTAAVDNSSYGNFVHDSAGYGLVQWTYWSLKEGLLNYARSQGTSISDWKMQVDYFLKEMKEEYTAIWKALTTAKTVREASDAVLLKFERPADQSSPVQEKRASYGEELFKKYSANTASTPAEEEPEQKTSQTAGCTAEKLIAVAAAEIGYKEKASNSQLDDPTANAGSANYTKYARDFDQKYPNWYNGKKNGYAWCDMFVDWCFLTAFGYENALRLTCQPEKSAGAGCTYSLRYYKSKGQFHTSGPKPGDQIFFGTSIDNSSHTGIVEKVDGSKVYTIEGNTGDMVARRSYALNNSRILGYGRPAYDAEGTTVTPAVPTTTTYYRVRRTWEDKNSQIGAFSIFANAKACADLNPGYYVFLDGKVVYPVEEQKADASFRVKVSISDLNIRTGPGTNYSKTGKYTGKGVFTIVETVTGQGSDSGWGRLKSGAGWISLDYCQKL